MPELSVFCWVLRLRESLRARKWEFPAERNWDSKLNHRFCRWNVSHFWFHFCGHRKRIYIYICIYFSPYDCWTPLQTGGSRLRVTSEGWRCFRRLSFYNGAAGKMTSRHLHMSSYETKTWNQTTEWLCVSCILEVIAVYYLKSVSNPFKSLIGSVQVLQTVWHLPKCYLIAFYLSAQEKESVVEILEHRGIKVPTRSQRRRYQCHLCARWCNKSVFGLNTEAESQQGDGGAQVSLMTWLKRRHCIKASAPVCWLTVTTPWGRAFVNSISPTCVFPAMTDQSVCCMTVTSGVLNVKQVKYLMHYKETKV